MTRIKILVLAAVVTFTATGCGRAGLAFLAGLEVIAAAASVAHTVAEAERAQHEREAIARAEAERAAYYAAKRAAVERAAAPGLPPGSVIVVPACAPEE